MMSEKPPTPKKSSRHILSVPFTAGQMAELARRAASRPLSAYVREQLFPANDNQPLKTVRTKPSEKKAFAAKTLALLGPAKHSIESIAHGIASGLLPFSPDTEAALLKACADIADMKTLLMKALGLRER